MSIVLKTHYHEPDRFICVLKKIWLNQDEAKLYFEPQTESNPLWGRWFCNSCRNDRNLWSTGLTGVTDSMAGAPEEPRFAWEALRSFGLLKQDCLLLRFSSPTPLHQRGYIAEMADRWWRVRRVVALDIVLVVSVRDGIHYFSALFCLKNFACWQRANK